MIWITASRSPGTRLGKDYLIILLLLGILLIELRRGAPARNCAKGLLNGISGLLRYFRRAGDALTLRSLRS